MQTHNRLEKNISQVSTIIHYSKIGDQIIIKGTISSISKEYIYDDYDELQIHQVVTLFLPRNDKAVFHVLLL